MAPMVTKMSSLMLNLARAGIAALVIGSAALCVAPAYVFAPARDSGSIWFSAPAAAPASAMAAQNS